MPVAYSSQSSNLDLLLVDQADADFRSQEEFGGFHVRACCPKPREWYRFVSPEPDPEHVACYDEPLTAYFGSPHQPKTEMRKKVSRAGAEAETAAIRACSGAMRSGKPEIGAHS